MFIDSTTIAFTLETNGIQYEGLISGSITNSFENLSGEFTCDVSYPQNKIFPIKRGDACRILIYNTPVLTGYVNKIDTSLSADSHTITISGRDKTCDIIDNTLPAKFSINTPISIIDITKKILSLYGITEMDVKVEVQGVSIFSANEIVAAEVGEMASDFLEKYAKKRQLILSTDGAGNIIYTRAENVIISDFININTGINQGNVLSAEMSVDDSKRFGKYILISQSNASGNGAIDDSEQSSVEEETYTTATSIDDEIRSARIFNFISDTTLQDQKSRQDRADWEKNVRKANGFIYSLTIQGFKNSKGVIWRPNMLININDNVNSIYADLLILSVQFNLSLDGGTQTKLTLTTPDAFVVKTTKKTKADAKSKKIANDYITNLSQL